MKARVGPGRPLSTDRVTEASSRTASSPERPAVSARNRATASSVPLTEGMATRSLRSSISVGKIHSEVGGLLFPAHDHGRGSRVGEHIQEQIDVQVAADNVGSFTVA